MSKFVILALIATTFVLCCCTRSAQWHLRKAKTKGITFVTDTATRDEFFYWPEVVHDTLWVWNTDTVTIETERTVVKTKVDTVTRRIYQHITEKADTLHDVDTLYRTVIEPGEPEYRDRLPWWAVLAGVVLVLTVGLLVIKK